MITNSKARKSKELFYIILLCILFFMTSAMIRSINMMNYSVELGGMTLDIRSLSGVINVLQISIMILLVLVNYKTGLTISYILLVWASLGLVGSIQRSHSLGAVPGMIMNIAGAFIIFIISAQLKRNDENMQSLENMTVTDSLTGLPNKQGLLIKMAKENEARGSFFLLQLDLDDFKEINDSMGHRVGDRVLQIVAERLAKMDVNGGMVARSGGDEFTLLVKRKSDYDITAFAEECIKSIGDGIEIVEYNYKCFQSVSIGICHCPVNGRSAENLLKYVDMAMYEAKKKGKNRACIFSADMEVQVRRKLDVEEYIRLALEKDRFYLMFQPQYDAGTKKLRGFESLLRMNKGDGEQISPGEFIPVAESSELILRIDNFVIKRVLSQFKDIIIESGNNIVVSVNVSAKHMLEEGFAQKVCNAVAEAGFPPQCLEIEITEYCLLASMEKAFANIRVLRDYGIRIALDDFGTGYTSLSYLAKLPIDILKVDKAFIDDIEYNQVSRDFAETIIALGHLLRCEVVCEGVEKEGQLNILKEQGCDFIQGYIWGKPLEYDEAVKLIHDER